VALRGRGSGKRRRFLLASKGGIVPGSPYDSSAAHLVSACEASLERPQTEHIDLYQIHRPDILTHPEEVAEALTKLRDAGKIRAAGISNHSAAQVAARTCAGVRSSPRSRPSRRVRSRCA
jgi:aryl-alcohol dehydrogenase-like predicted oxidoreductase